MWAGTTRYVNRAIERFISRPFRMRPLFLLCCLIPFLGCATLPQVDWSDPTIATFFVGFEPISSIGIDGAPVVSWYGEMPLMGAPLHGVEKADASGFGYMAGLSGMFWRGWGWPGIRWGIRPGVRYLHQHVDAALDRTISTEVVTSSDSLAEPHIASVPARIESSADFDMIQVTAAFTQEFGTIGRSSLGLFLSPGFSYVMVANRFESMELGADVEGRFFNPAGLPTTSNGRKLIVYDADPNTHSDIRFSLVTGLQLESRISTYLSLLSSVEYDFPFWPARSRQENLNSLSARVALMWNIDWVMILE
jgi:hypothetical protein